MAECRRQEEEVEEIEAKIVNIVPLEQDEYGLYNPIVQDGYISHGLLPDTFLGLELKAPSGT